MPTTLGHLELRVNGANLPFYRDLFAFLGWRTLHDDATMLGVSGTDGSSLWFGSGAKDVANDYDGPGVNHIAVAAQTQAEVDVSVDYLRSHNIATLFDTPAHRPDFIADPSRTYYQVMFESPDRILLEVVYTGPKT